MNLSNFFCIFGLFFLVSKSPNSLNRFPSSTTYPYFSLIVLAILLSSSIGNFSPLYLTESAIKEVIFDPAMGTCLIQLPITYPSETGIT